MEKEKLRRGAMSWQVITSNGHPGEHPESMTRGSPPEMLKGAAQARSPHHVLLVDIQFDQSRDGRSLKSSISLNEHSRICFSIRPGRGERPLIPVA